MMGRQSGQIVFEVIDIDSMVPKDHLLRKIKQTIDFDFIYEKTKDLYAPNGRPSIDPVLLIKMLLTGYLYGVKSERKLEEEINLNLAYRWLSHCDASSSCDVNHHLVTVEYHLVMLPCHVLASFSCAPQMSFHPRSSLPLVGKNSFHPPALSSVHA